MDQEILIEEIPEKDIEIEEEQMSTPDAPTEEAQESVGEDELEDLRKEIEDLRGELSRREALDESNKRMLRECEEFKEYFPDAELSSVPDEVWERVKGGLPLSAAYALFARRIEMQKSRVEQINRKNREMSAGSVRNGGDEGYYSPAEVKAMTPDQVRANYTDIIESMRHWN